MKYIEQSLVITEYCRQKTGDSNTNELRTCRKGI